MNTYNKKRNFLNKQLYLLTSNDHHYSNHSNTNINTS